MPLATHDFQFFSNMVRMQSGIVLQADKEYLFESRLLPVAKAAGFSGLSDLANSLRRAPNRDLAFKVIDAMTTNETTFFRDFHPFEALRKSILPDLVKRRADARELNIWCGAASSGQEPYSLAILLLEHFPQIVQGWKLSFIATDLSLEMLDRCRRGAYSQVEVNRGLPAALLAKYFSQAAGEYRISDKVKGLVQFRQANLLEPLPLMPPPDLVFLRNVLIYFDLEVKRQILGRIRRAMRPDGLVLLGGTESTMNVDPAFERIQYEKTGCYRLAGREA